MQPHERDWSLTAADPADADLMYGLLEGARWVHRHLDWSQPADLLSMPAFLMAYDDGLPAACISAPPGPGDAVWLRLFAVASGYDLRSVWREMWPQAAAAAREAGGQTAAALPLADWLPALLEQSGFTHTDDVVFLEWSASELPPQPAELPEVSPLHMGELRQVLEVDHKAFDPLWRLATDGMAQAFAQADYAACVRRQGVIAGYQMCTVSDAGSHLARLAVHPQFQRQHVATTLVLDAMQHYLERRIRHLSVNTQGSNARGLKLYDRLGFRPTGQRLPVLTRDLEVG